MYVLYSSEQMKYIIHQILHCTQNKFVLLLPICIFCRILSGSTTLVLQTTNKRSSLSLSTFIYCRIIFILARPALQVRTICLDYFAVVFGAECYLLQQQALCTVCTTGEGYFFQSSPVADLFRVHNMEFVYGPVLANCIFFRSLLLQDFF